MPLLDPFAPQDGSPATAPVPSMRGQILDPTAPKAEPARPRETAGDLGLGMARHGMEGLTFNFGDEISAAMHATTAVLSGKNPSWRDAYNAHLEQARGKLADFAGRHPTLAAGANIAGSLAAPIPFLGDLGAATTIGGAVARGGALGAAQGAASGFGAGEGTRDRLMGAAVGGGLGAAAGAVVGGGLKAAQTVAGRFSEPVARREGQAILGQALGREALPPEELARRVELGNRAGVTGMTLGDVAESGPVRALAEDVVQHPNDMQGLFGSAVARRQMGELTERGEWRGGQPAGIASALQQATGVADRRALETARQLAATRRANAAALFGQAQQFVPASNPAVARTWQDVIASDYGKQALAATRRIWSTTNPRQPFPLDDPRNLSAIPDMRIMQMFKEGLDDTVSRLYREGAGQEAGAARALRDRFRDVLTAANPTYGQALRQYAGDTAMQDALEAGQKAMRAPADEVEAFLAHASPGEAEQYRIGAVTALVDKMRAQARGPTVDHTRDLLMKEDNLRRIMALMPDEGSRQWLTANLQARARQSGLAARVLGNSATSRRQETARMVEAGAPTAGELRARVPLTLPDIAATLYNRIAGPIAERATAARRAAIGRALMARDARAAAMIRQAATTPPPLENSLLIPRASRAGGAYVGGLLMPQEQR